jgi:hypothetical protein
VRTVAPGFSDIVGRAAIQPPVMPNSGQHAEDQCAKKNERGANHHHVDRSCQTHRKPPCSESLKLGFPYEGTRQFVAAARHKLNQFFSRAVQDTRSSVFSGFPVL